jgi:hypothetical protein
MSRAHRWRLTLLIAGSPASASVVILNAEREPNLFVQEVGISQFGDGPFIPGEAATHT